MKFLVVFRRKCDWCRSQYSFLRWIMLILSITGFAVGAVYFMWCTPLVVYVLDRLRLRKFFLPNTVCIGCNNFTYPYMIDNRNFCTDSGGKLQPVFLLILVASFHANLDARQAIRKSWGSLREYEGQTIRTLFIFGRHDDSNYNYQIQYELKHYGDVIQVRSLDILQCLHSSILILFTVLLVHLIMHISPHHYLSPLSPSITPSVFHFRLKTNLIHIFSIVVF